MTKQQEEKWICPNGIRCDKNDKGGLPCPHETEHTLKYCKKRGKPKICPACVPVEPEPKNSRYKCYDCLWYKEESVCARCNDFSMFEPKKPEGEQGGLKELEDYKLYEDLRKLMIECSFEAGNKRAIAQNEFLDKLIERYNIKKKEPVKQPEQEKCERCEGKGILRIGGRGGERICHICKGTGTQARLE